MLGFSADVQVTGYPKVPRVQEATCTREDHFSRFSTLLVPRIFTSPRAPLRAHTLPARTPQSAAAFITGLRGGWDPSRTCPHPLRRPSRAMIGRRLMAGVDPEPALGTEAR